MKKVSGYQSLLIARHQRFFGNIGPPAKTHSHYKLEFEVAKKLLENNYVNPGEKPGKNQWELGTWRQELERLPGPKFDPKLLNFLQDLLIVDHTKRPTPREALKHPYLQDVD